MADQDTRPDWAKGKEAVTRTPFFKFEKVGDSIAGEIMAVVEGVYDGKPNHVIHLRTKDGMRRVAGNTQLLDFIRENKLIRMVVGIVYKGSVKTKQNNDVKTFDLFKLTPEEAQITAPNDDDDDLPF